MADVSRYQAEQVTEDVIANASQFQAISVSTTAVEAKGGTTRLVNRKVLIIAPTNNTVYWGTSSSVTTATGSPIYSGQQLTLAFADTIQVYLIAPVTTDVRVMEGS